MEKLENSSNQELQNESIQIKQTDSMGREKFWEDIGRKDD